ncbi:hypothetical protein DEO72_LG5g121 [Vigna unguiculata]|uniref:Uncharacterized protein n=1 Tax=Vigna unguiculata TaxID=3917 RepID=A0A4D6LUE5_VIGUN|nr:hypothetical protein DEO72_LG5g121 [Vigna unguiculata]
MGNSPSGPRLLGNGKYSSYNITLGKATTISVTKDLSGWKLVYDVDGMTSTLSILKTAGRNSGDNKVRIDIVDCIYSKTVRPRPRERFTLVVEENEETGGLGTNGTRMGFLSQEMKRSNEKRRNMVTVAHYYVNNGGGGGGNFGASGGVDIGFSVVVKIGMLHGHLDFSVDGPVEHPSSALLYMIEEVIQARTWKRPACPHCKTIQSQRRWLSESEDSDTTFPAPPSHGTQQTTSNNGRFNGDGIGSMIRANKVSFNKWWR